jgi:hypothetical protein
MGTQDDNFNARIKRVQARSSNHEPMPGRRHKDDDGDDRASISAILLPQLAFILGMAALIAGRAISMNYYMIEPSTDLLRISEGAVILVLLVVIALLFGRSSFISHGALVVGACLAFLAEEYYIPVVPDMMEAIYNPNYVSLVILNAR